MDSHHSNHKPTNYTLHSGPLFTDLKQIPKSNDYSSLYPTLLGMLLALSFRYSRPMITTYHA
ncbi:hypothetical protein BDV09DRAFT_173393 [Aspergillus tetrazonus]